MKSHFSLSQYRSFDLISFAVITAVFEGLIAFASTRLFPDQLYVVSAVAGITAIVMVRWKYAGILPAFVGGFVLCTAYGGSPRQYLVYCIGNLLGIFGVFIQKLIREEKMRANSFLAMLYGISVLFLMQTGRALVALILGYELKDVAFFYTTDSLSYIFVAVILLVASRQDGMLEDQVHYIRRIQESGDSGKTD